MVFLFAPVKAPATVRGRYICLAAISVLRFKIGLCLLLKSAGLKTAATFLALRLPAELPLVLLARALVALRLARARLLCPLVLLGEGRGFLRRCRRRA
jgi:hypothetical protein